MAKNPNDDTTPEERRALVDAHEALFGVTLAQGLRQAILNGGNLKGIGQAITVQLRNARKKKPSGGQGGRP